MSRFHVVTTMHEKGWAETGRRMAESFVERWPAEALPLAVYAEGFTPDPMEGVEIRRLPEWLSDFKKRYGNIPTVCGRRYGKYHYRWDCVKFAHKVAAMTDYAATVDDGVMIWMDADTFTHADVTADWLNGLFPAPNYLAWIDRQNSHPETGYIMFRASHRHHQDFFRALKHLYKSGKVLSLRHGTCDSDAIQWVGDTAHRAGLIEAPVSLSGGYNAWHHPFVNGPLGAKLDHMKGARKAEGRSRNNDFRRPRSEPYWAGK